MPPIPMRAWFTFGNVLAAVLFVFVSTARSDELSPVIEVVGTEVRPVVVAVPLPSHAKSGPDAAWISKYDARIRKAIDFHGALATLDRAAELASVGEPDKLDAAPWHAAGAEILLQVRVTQNAGETVCDAYLFDVAERRSLLSRRFRLAGGSAEDMADAVASAVIETLLGVPSPFTAPIVFQYRAPGDRWRELYRTDWSGTSLRKLSDSQKLVLNPAFVPGENRVLAVGYFSRRPALVLFDLTRGTVRDVLRSETTLHGPAVFPDGRSAVVAWERGGNTDLYRVDLETGAAQRLTTSGAADLSPTLSPDGRRIAYVSDRRGNPYLYVLDVETLVETPLLLEGLYLGEPDWSPDGKSIVFTRRDRGTGFGVWVLDVETGRSTAVTPQLSESLESPAWAPDSRTIVYSDVVDGRSQILKVDRQVKQPRLLTRLPGDARMPAWARGIP